MFLLQNSNYFELRLGINLYLWIFRPNFTIIIERKFNLTQNVRYNLLALVTWRTYISRSFCCAQTFMIETFRQRLLNNWKQESKKKMICYLNTRFPFWFLWREIYLLLFWLQVKSSIICEERPVQLLVLIWDFCEVRLLVYL